MAALECAECCRLTPASAPCVVPEKKFWKIDILPQFSKDGKTPYIGTGLRFVLHPVQDIVVQAEDLAAAMLNIGFNEFSDFKVRP